MRANLLFYRNRLTAYHAFIYIRVTFGQKTIHRDLLTGADTHQIINVQLIQRYIQFFTVAYYTGFLRLQTHQFADSSGSISLRTFLHEFTCQNEGDDNHSSFVIDMRLQSTAIPEIGEESIKDAEQESNGCT